VDGGKPFLAHFAIVAEDYGIKKVVTIPYHSQSNGQDESTNKLFLDRIRKDNSDQTGRLIWDMKAHVYAGMINRRIQKSRGNFSAAELLYGYQDGLPNTNIENYNWNQRMQLWQIVDLKSRMCVVESLREEAIRRRKDFHNNKIATRWNAKVKNQQYKVGDMVLLLNKEKSTSRSLNIKLTPNWLGPMQVVQVHDLDTYTVQPLQNPSKVIRTSADFMKSYWSRDSCSFRRKNGGML
jgi:hypothetical protein